MPKIPLGAFILQRLHQNGVHHLHGVPGDFSLPFLSHVKNSPVKWIGNCNELNAGYAADGYARMKGLGVLCTTYGVGELSAINAIAGSYSEQVSVINIVGTPNRHAVRDWSKHQDRDGKGLIHHMLGRGTRMDEYMSMHKNITAKRVILDGEATAPIDFDGAIQSALLQRKPVYVSLPSDMPDVLVDGDSLQQSIPLNHSRDDQACEKMANILVKDISSATRPLIIVDGLSDRYQLREEINDLVRMTGIPTLCLQHGLGIVESDHPNYHGVYTGSLASPDMKEYVDSSDFVVLIGGLLSDTGTAGWSAVPNMQRTVRIEGSSVEYKDTRYMVQARQVLSKVLESPRIDQLGSKSYPSPTKQWAPVRSTIPSGNSAISQDYLWPRMSSFFRSGDTILLANGTPLLGSKLFNLPPMSESLHRDSGTRSDICCLLLKVPL